MKYYAVKKGRTPGIYTTWEACKEQINKYSNAVFKKFSSLEDADAFMNETDDKYTNDQPSQQPYAYIDGSFNSATNTYGYGGFIKVNTHEYIIQGSGNNPSCVRMRNVAGEINGCMAAVAKAIELRLPSITIYYDYQGIESWATCDWKAKNEWTCAYRDFMRNANRVINIKFVKVKGHTGIDGNERADRLAKEAVGI